jgi:hypothetical protein
VQPSGTAQPIVINVNKGDDIQQNILMSGSAYESDDAAQEEEDHYETPLPLPQSRDWAGTLSGYDKANYFLLDGQANRTLVMKSPRSTTTGSPRNRKLNP